MKLPPLQYTLFPYTTLFRSWEQSLSIDGAKGQQRRSLAHPDQHRPHRDNALSNLRSEEHTSELQSPDHLVCRLLLEKKKTVQLAQESYVVIFIRGISPQLEG